MNIIIIDVSTEMSPQKSCFLIDLYVFWYSKLIKDTMALVVIESCQHTLFLFVVIGKPIEYFDWTRQ